MKNLPTAGAAPGALVTLGHKTAIAGVQAGGGPVVEKVKMARLFSHIWDGGKKIFEREAFWGVGNGWAAAGMTRVLRALPESMRDERMRLVGCIREVLDGCLKHRGPDGHRGAGLLHLDGGGGAGPRSLRFRIFSSARRNGCRAG